MNDPISPGEGWRILKEGEVAVAGVDQRPLGAEWGEVEMSFTVRNHSTVRRRIERTREESDHEAFVKAINLAPINPNSIERYYWFAALAYARKGDS